MVFNNSSDEAPSEDLFIYVDVNFFCLSEQMAQYLKIVSSRNTKNKTTRHDPGPENCIVLQLILQSFQPNSSLEITSLALKHYFMFVKLSFRSHLKLLWFVLWDWKPFYVWRIYRPELSGLTNVPLKTVNYWTENKWQNSKCPKKNSKWPSEISENWSRPKRLFKSLAPLGEI